MGHDLGMVAERWTERSGIRIRYLDNDPDEAHGLPVLFSPGLSDYADDYLPALEHFLPRRVLVVEVRGRGGSDSPPTGYAVADHVRDLRAVLDEEGIDRFHVMTFSRGSSWALELSLEEPDRVASLSIGDYLAAEIQLPTTFAQHQLALTWRGVPIKERMAGHVLVELSLQSRARDLFERLPSIAAPLLVATGTEPGTILSEPVLDRYRACRPDVEVAIIPGASHDLFRPDRLAYPAAVAEFIDRRVPGS